MVATMLSKNKKNQNAKGNRLLISISVIGSSGPIRFIVNEEDLVAAVINTALKSYAREGRLPILGSNLDEFLLYCSNGESDALNPWDRIGYQGIRNFMLYKKPRQVKVNEDGKSMEAMKKVNGAALNPWDRIGSQGIRNFMLYKKPREVKVNEDGKSMEAMKKVNGRWNHGSTNSST